MYAHAEEQITINENTYFVYNDDETSVNPYSVAESNLGLDNQVYFADDNFDAYGKVKR